MGEPLDPPSLLSRLTFGQPATDLLALLTKAQNILEAANTSGCASQMLVIISDGRGVLAQGANKVRAALGALQGVTVLFVVLDTGKQSIDELKVASFVGGDVQLTPYLELFPFPFYALVRTLPSLPSVLAEAIRQWFEVSAVANF